MKKFSKILSLVLAVAMMATLVPTFVFAADAEDAASEREIITLFDFGNPENFANYNIRAKDAAPSAFAANGKSSSLKYTANIVFDEETKKYKQDDEAVDFYYDEINLKEYADADATLNIRFYTEAEGSKFNFVFLGSEDTAKIDITPDDGKDNPVPTYHQKQPAVDKGWQLYSVKLKDAIAKFANYDDDNIIDIRIVANAWGNLDATTGVGGYKDGDELFIDEVFVDTNPDGYYDEIKTVEGNYYIWESEIGYNGGGATKKYDADFGEYTMFSTKSTTMTFAQEYTTDSEGFRHYTTLFNTSDYKWLNLWMYSPCAQDDGLNILLYTNRKTGSTKKEMIDGKEVQMGIYVDEVQQKYANTYPIFHHIKQVDWEGWKLISIPVSGNNKIIGLDINVAGWNGNWYTNLPSAKDLKFGIDGIWMSSEEISPQAQWESERVFENTNAFASDENVIYDVVFNSADKVNTGVVLNYDNPFVNDANARFTFNSATYQNLYDVAVNNQDSKMPGAAKKTLYVFGSSSNKTDFIDAADGITDNSYINLWLYNPEVKYTWDGVNYGEIPLILGFWNGSKTQLCPVRIIANFEGWKLFSIPLKSINANLVSKGINDIYLTMNGGWFNVTKSATDPKVNSYKHTATELERGWISGGSVNVIARKYDLTNKKDVDGNNFNYIDLARLWITNGPADTEFNVTASDNSELFCLAEDIESVSLFETSENAYTSKLKAIKRSNDGSVSTFNPSVENGVLALGGKLGFGEEYSIYGEMVNVSGIKVSEDFTFKTERLHVSEMTVSEDGKTANVKMHGILSEDYANAVLVAAVYSENEGITKLETVNKADYNAQTGEITATVDAVSEGQTVKFMFLSGIDTLKPVADNVRN